MRYILYLFTMVLLFVAGMLVGNIFLPQRAASLASAVAVPDLSPDNPALQTSTRTQTQRNLEILDQAFSSCPVIVHEEKERLLNQIRLQLAVADFELKKAKFEFEIAKNNEINRPTSQFIQASSEYTQAKAYAEKLAGELFPLPPQEPQTADEKTAGAPTPAAKK